MQEITKYPPLTIKEFIENACSIDGKPTKVYSYQEEFFDSPSKFRIILKARQIGYSTAIAMESLYTACWHPDKTILFVSTGDRTSRLLMRNLRSLHASMEPFEMRFDVDGRSALATNIIKEDTQREVVFKNNSRIISLPNNPDGIRGYHASHVYLDEFAFFENPEEIWTAILPALTRGERLTINSTPAGTLGKFYEIWDEAEKGLNEFKRFVFPYDKIKHELSPQIIENIERIRGVTDKLQFDQEFNCVTPDTDIITNPSVKKISEIRVGDRVLTHAGRYEEVEFVNTRHYSGDMINIKTFKSCFPIKTTPNHPILAARKTMINQPRRKVVISAPKWLRADELTKEHVIAYPKMKEVEDVEYVLTKDYITYSKQGGKWKIYKMDKIPVNPDFMRLLGYYLSEGCIGAEGRSVSFCFGTNQPNMGYIWDVLDSVYRLFKIRGSLYKHDNCINVNFNCKNLAEILDKICGSGAGNKHLPIWIMKLPPEKQRHLINAYWNGDGCRTKTQNRSASISKKLTFQLRDMLIRLGHVPSLTYVAPKTMHIGGREHPTKPSYGLVFYNKISKSNRGKRHYEDKNFVYLDIQKIGKENYDGDVMNIQVKNDNSFCTNYHATHNCIFIDEKISMFPYELIKPCISKTEVPNAFKHKTANPIYMGVDFGIQRNSTVITFLEKTKDGWIVLDPIKEFVGAKRIEGEKAEGDFEPIMIWIEKALAEVRPTRCYVDANGMGERLSNELRRKYGGLVMPVKATNEIKEKLIINVRILFENQKITIPQNDILISQLHTLKKITTEGGTVRYRHDSGKFDDYVWSLAYALTPESIPAVRPTIRGVHRY